MELQHFAQLAISLMLVLVGSVVWFIRLEGRVNLLDRVLEDHIHEKRQNLAALEKRLSSIETKLDRIMVNCAWTQHSVGNQAPKLVPNGND